VGAAYLNDSPGAWQQVCEEFLSRFLMSASQGL
jgi:hypothetical protein